MNQRNQPQQKEPSQMAIEIYADLEEVAAEAEMSGSKLANELETKNPSCSSQSFGSD
jgi:hypothetical protein